MGLSLTWLIEATENNLSFQVSSYILQEVTYLIEHWTSPQIWALGWNPICVFKPVCVLGIPASWSFYIVLNSCWENKLVRIAETIGFESHWKNRLITLDLAYVHWVARLVYTDLSSIPV